MSPEERQLLIGLFDRTKSLAANQRDKEAEALIADAVRAQPYAPYLLAQTVLVQEQALSAASDRLRQLESEVEALKQQSANQQPASGGSFLGGLGSLFGGGQASNQAQQARPPQQPTGNPWQQSANQNPSGAWGQRQPDYPPQAGPAGPWGAQPIPQPPQAPNQGGGFLKGALGAAAGVAGGVLLADSLRGLLGGHNNSLGIGSGFTNAGLGGTGAGTPGSETIINNYYGSDDQTHQADWHNDTNHYPDDPQNAADDGDSDYGDDGSYDV